MPPRVSSSSRYRAVEADEEDVIRPATDTGKPSRPYWLWPYRPSSAIARRTLRVARQLGERIGPCYRWWLLGLVLGPLPIGLDLATGVPMSRITTALLLAPLFVAAVALNSMARGLGVVAAVFLGHSLSMILLAALAPGWIVDCFPPGFEYWEKSRAWIVTGISPEYDLSWWLPAQVQLLGAVAVFTYTSLGFLTFWQGLYEVDLMNVYVGHLLAHSRVPWLALACGWHPWSLCRGLGYLVLTFEIVSLSLSRLTGVTLATRRERGGRLLVGLGFLVADGLIKYFFLDSVRQTLAGNLLEP